MIRRIIIKNFKSIKNADITFSGKNVIVGNNDVGKSTILEAISLTLGNGSTSLELTPYLFHKSTWRNLSKTNLPSIIIELYMDSIDEYAEYTGKNNSLHEDCLGIRYEAKFDEEYIDLLEDENLTQIPCEYYIISRKWFSEDVVKPFKMPFSVQVINSASALYNIKMSQFITKHLQSNLSDENNKHLKTTLRGLREIFNQDAKVSDINQQLTEISKQFHDKLEISLDLTTYSAWNAISCPFVDDIPVYLNGQGSQCILKTLVSLSSNERQDKQNIYLIEEPESHLSHTYMYNFLQLLEEKMKGQYFLTTHNSYIANRLNLSNLIIISNIDGEIKTCTLNGKLDQEMYNYFYTTTDYPTLRLALCKKAILVEGPTDEMIVQYHLKKTGINLFEDSTELLAVGGVRFKNFISLAIALNKPIAIITDNDSKSVEEIQRLYIQDDDRDYSNVKIFTPSNPELHTLEVVFAQENNERITELANIIRKKEFQGETINTLTEFMIGNKTTWAFRLLENNDLSFKVPQYIQDAINWIYNG